MTDYESGRVLAGRYRLERELGRGAMGSVWVATDDKLRRPVAVKVMKDRAASDEHSLARFELEAMAVARLRSPYVVQVYDYGVEGGCPFIVMELLEGQDLAKRIKQTPHPLPFGEATRIIVHAAKGLHVAHEAGIVHRDLKPANIFLVEEHGEAIAKVFDFGIAKALGGESPDSEMTAEGVLLGTPRYMSPEQAHGARRVDHRTDLWSLAVIAYLCVTARYPFRGSGVGEIIAAICTAQPEPPTRLFPILPVEVDLFFETALAKDPDRRYQTARELGAAFARLTDASIPSLDISASGMGELPCPALDASRPSGFSAAEFSALPPSPEASVEAAARSLVQGRQRRRRFGIVAASCTAVGVVGGSLLVWAMGGGGSQRTEGTPSASAERGAGGGAHAEIDVPRVASSEAASGGDSGDSGTLEPLPEVSVTAEPPSRPAVTSPVRSASKSSSGAASAKPVPAAASSREPAATKPPPKRTGDGLEQFDDRF